MEQTLLQINLTLVMLDIFAWYITLELYNVHNTYIKTTQRGLHKPRGQTRGRGAAQMTTTNSAGHLSYMLH